MPVNSSPLSKPRQENAMADQVKWIRVRGAREHNLQNIDVDLPRQQLTVLTGPSGSGKSTLAFDTLFAEGQRRYLETVGVDSRALFDQLQRPDVDVVEGLPPTLCVAQHLGAPHRRSTLATLTEIHDHLRLLWARLGTPHCYQCGTPIRRHSLAEIVHQTLQRPAGQKVFVLAPLVRDQKGEHKEVFQELRRAGFLRARINGVLIECRDNPKLNPRQCHTIELVIDRLVIRDGLEDRLIESLQTAIKHSGGPLIITEADDGDWHDQMYSTRYACPKCNISYADLTPRSFSFNNPHGACSTCGGMGWVGKAEESEEEDNQGDAVTPPPMCPECGGARLNKEARSVQFAGKGLHEITALTVDEALAWFNALPASKANRPQQKIQSLLVREILLRLEFLAKVGLGYLTLDRPAPTLSGGEMQRARLATHLGAGLLGVCYILDEPTIGLHPRDTNRLIEALRGLQQRGNTVIIVEHDEAIIRQADYLIDMGPGAGKQGGRVLASGTVEQVLRNPESVTGRWLTDPSLRGPVAKVNPRPIMDPANAVTIVGARHHNLKNITVAFPLGKFVCVTGVSGSGKSSLALDILGNVVRRHLGLKSPPPGEHDRVTGFDGIDRLIEVDQAPLGRSSRSSPATYTGIFDEIRRVFAKTKEAKIRGFGASRFSFNVRGGRCEVCLGHGSRKVALDFLPDLTVPCPACRGRRFNAATLAIRFKGKSIADVLDLCAADALAFFANVPGLVRPLEALVDVGLGYLTLGQSSSTLSGGEAQRVKLAAELAKTATGQTLFLLDEPTTGLHFADVANLLVVLRKLVDKGNTLVILEHNLDVIAAADWVIDLGPEGGAGGGYLLAAGTPAELAKSPVSITGQFLRKAPA
jgi:excinuclease ABC subunit A